MKRHRRVPMWATPDQRRDNAALREHYQGAIDSTDDPEAVEIVGDLETGEHVIERGLDLKPIASLVNVLKQRRKA